VHLQFDDKKFFELLTKANWTGVQVNWKQSAGQQPKSIVINIASIPSALQKRFEEPKVSFELDTKSTFAKSPFISLQPLANRDNPSTYRHRKPRCSLVGTAGN